MVPRAFDFDDVLASHDALRAAPDTPQFRERLLARVERGPAPSFPAALLAERGDRRSEPWLTGLAAFLDPPDVLGLCRLGAAEPLAAVVAAPWLPLPLRAAAAEGLAALPPTAVALCVLAEVAHQERGAPPTDVLAAVDALTLRADDATRLAADKLRTRARLARTWVGVRRQELQREVATGALHPVVALLAGDPSFLATLVPPLADHARATLLPCLLANVRADEPEARRKTFGLLHGRWRDVARQPVSGLARFARLRGRESPLPVLAVHALAAMGATVELLYAAVSGTPEVRSAALAALERLEVRLAAEVPLGLIRDAAEHLELGADADAARRLRRFVRPGS